MSVTPKSPAPSKKSSDDFSGQTGLGSLSNNIAETQNRGFEYGVVHWRSKVSGHLLTQVQDSLQMTRAQIIELLELGAIYGGQGRLLQLSQLDTSSPAETYLRLHTKPRRFAIAVDLSARVVFSNEDFIVVNKPAGLPCHPTVDNVSENLLAQLSQKLKQELYITHRLDVGTSGLVALAKTQTFQAYFNAELSHRRVIKYYEALIEGIPTWYPDQILTHWLKPSPRAPKHMSKIPTLDWNECRLRIIELHTNPLSLESRVKLELLTGRTHQIRAQLATEGHPLVGDTMYGAVTQIPNQNVSSFMLQAQHLSFKYQDQNMLFEL